MALGRAFSVAVRGLDGEIVEIEADITSGLPGVHRLFLDLRPGPTAVALASPSIERAGGYMMGWVIVEGNHRKPGGLVGCPSRCLAG